MRGQILYLTGSIFTLLLGLFAGYVLGTHATPTAAARSAASGPASLELSVPEGTAVTLDGQSVTPPRISLAPGKDHQLHLSAPDQQPIDIPLHPEPGEHLVYEVHWKSPAQ